MSSDREDSGREPMAEANRDGDVSPFIAASILGFIGMATVHEVLGWESIAGYAGGFTVGFCVGMGWLFISGTAPLWLWEALFDR